MANQFDQSPNDDDHLSDTNNRHQSEEAESNNRQPAAQNRYAHLISGQQQGVQKGRISQNSSSTTAYKNNNNNNNQQQQRHNNYHNQTYANNNNQQQQHRQTGQPVNSTINTNQQQQQHSIATNASQSNQPIQPASCSSAPAANQLAPDGQQRQQQQLNWRQQHNKSRPDNFNYYYSSSFSSVDWREQWLMLKDKTMRKVGEPDCQRKLIMLIVCTALLLDNMLYMVIVPIIPDYLRSIGAWSTYTENAKWIRRNGSHGRSEWAQVGGQVIYEGEDSAVGFLFASKAIVQLIANPFSGAIADRIGYEIPMMFGLVVMFLSTMVFACGQTYSVLFLARSLQGVGSAFADTPGIAMLADRFTEEKERRRAQGIAIAFISFGCLVAPPFGSVLYQGAGKEVPFIILSLVCLLDSSLLLLVAPPGTFSQLWPGNGGLKGAQTSRAQREPTPGAAAAAANCPTRAPAQPDTRQQAQPPPPEATPPSGAGQATREPQDWGAGDQSAAVCSSAPKPKPKLKPKPEPSGARGGALARQKSISRRHSITVAAGGEAPRGTPIEVLLRDKCIACCAGALVVANISLAFLEPTISIWVRNTMPDTEEWQEGLIWLPAFFPHVLGVFSTLHVAEKYPRSTWMIATAGLVIEGLGCLIVPFCSSFWSLIIPISVICFGVALIDTAILPTLGYLVDTRFTSVYGNVYAIADISYSVSYAIGPIIAGGIVEAIGFTALNVLIAVVTLGYTPSLMMLSSVHDYEPFEADQTGLRADRAKPFGQFGRQPIAEEEDEDEDADDDDDGKLGSSKPLELSGAHRADHNTNQQAQLQQQQQMAPATRYESPAWASSGGGGGARQTKSVTIFEAQPSGGHEHGDGDGLAARDNYDNNANQQPQQQQRNPFLG